MTANLFQRLDALARNLRWSWHRDSQRLFAAIDPLLWQATNHNPIRVMRLLSPERREALARDERFARHLDRCERELKEYLSARTWFDRSMKTGSRKPVVAYFCSEFAVHES